MRKKNTDEPREPPRPLPRSDDDLAAHLRELEEGQVNARICEELRQLSAVTPEDLDEKSVDGEAAHLSSSTIHAPESERSDAGQKSLRRPGSKRAAAEEVTMTKKDDTSRDGTRQGDSSSKTTTRMVVRKIQLMPEGTGDLPEFEIAKAPTPTTPPPAPAPVEAADEEDEPLNGDGTEIVDPPPLPPKEPVAADKPFTPVELEYTTEYSKSLLTPALLKAGYIGLKEYRSTRTKAIRWDWEGIAAADNQVEISGPPFSGKTTLAFLIAVASASTQGPVEVFGRVVTPVPRGKIVIIVEEENSIRSCAGKLEFACEMLGLDPARTMCRILSLVRTGFTPDSDLVGDIRIVADKGALGRLFLDSRARIFPGQANAEEDQAEASRWILDIMNRGRCSVWLVSHTRKGHASELEDVSGSAQRSAMADTVILVTARTTRSGKVLESQVVYKKIREEEGDEEHPCTIRWRTSKQNGRWRYDHKEISDREIDDSPVGRPLRDQILDALREAEDEDVVAPLEAGELTVRSIRKKCGDASPARMQPVIDEMIAAKEIVLRTVSGIRGTKGPIGVIRLRRKSDFDSFEELRGDNDEDGEER